MNTITVVSQLINQARVEYGDVDAIALPESLWEAGLDEVASAGGEVGLDHFIVDGITLLRLDQEDSAAVHLPGGAVRALPLTA